MLNSNTSKFSIVSCPYLIHVYEEAKVLISL